MIFSESQSSKPVQFPDALPEKARFSTVHVELERAVSLADPEYIEETLKMDLEKSPAQEHYDRWSEENQKCISQLFGFPLLVQGYMRIECALVDNGFDVGDETGYGEKELDELSPEANEWILLFQLDPDDSRIGIPWAGSDRMFFWIKQTDLMARRFEKAWMIRQSP